MDKLARRWSQLAEGLFVVGLALCIASIAVFPVLPWIGALLAMILNAWASRMADRRIRSVLRHNRGEICFGCEYLLHGSPEGGSCSECGKRVDAGERRDVLEAWGVDV